MQARTLPVQIWTLLWSERYDGPDHGDDSPLTSSSLAIGPDDSVVVTGYSRSAPYQAADFATIKYVSPPALTIRRSADEVVVSWPSSAIDFTLQQNAALGTTNWSNLTGAIQDDGTNRALIVSPPTGQEFYRLYKP